MEILSIEIKPIQKIAAVWDAVTVTVVKSDEKKIAHLKTYLVNKEGNIVGKTETDFVIKANAPTAVEQSVLTYSPDLGEDYIAVCEIEGDKKDRKFQFPVL